MDNPKRELVIRRPLISQLYASRLNAQKANLLRSTNQICFARFLSLGQEAVFSNILDIKTTFMTH